MLLARLILALLAIGLSTASASPPKLTIYDDGLACPGNCDAHVVFASSMNGTKFAHDPKTSAKPYRKCKNGHQCRICLDTDGEQCLEVMYRGSGPPAHTFDFTPRFYAEACTDTPDQARLADQCAAYKKAEESLRATERVNCIAEPEHERCVDLITRATEARTADRLSYQSCLAAGENAYNANVPPERQRLHRCTYERFGTGVNSRGVTWRKLLPGVCRDGTFVGQFGLDCCSGDPTADGPMGIECRVFYPRR